MAGVTFRVDRNAEAAAAGIKAHGPPARNAPALGADPARIAEGATAIERIGAPVRAVAAVTDARL